MTILLLDLYFKINGWIYKDILLVLVKNSLNLIIFLPILGGMKIWGEWKFEILRDNKKNECFLILILFPPT